MKRIPFDPKELTVVGQVPPDRPWMQPSPIFSPVVPPKENFLAYLRGETPLWMPSFFDVKRFDPLIFPDNIARGLVSETRPFDPVKEGGGKDMFGIEWTYEPANRGSMIRQGDPAVKDINHWEDYVTKPDLDSWDWEGCAKANLESLQDGRVVQMTILNGFFERLMSFLDMEGAAIALVDEEEQEGVHRLFDYLCGLYDEMMKRMRTWFGCDMIWLHDDWGCQRGPLISPDTCREMIAPYLKRVVDSAHKYGMYFELHSCGKNELMVPIMIECGVDAWNGQEMNDKKMLCEKYGRQIKLGVNPDALATPDTTRPPVSEETMREFFRQVLRDFPNGDVYMGMFMGYPANANLILYEESRKAYSQLT